MRKKNPTVFPEPSSVLSTHECKVAQDNYCVSFQDFKHLRKTVVSWVANPLKRNRCSFSNVMTLDPLSHKQAPLGPLLFPVEVRKQQGELSFRANPVTSVQREAKGWRELLIFLLANLTLETNPL